MVRGGLDSKVEVVLRQVHLDNMRDVLKECKIHKWTHILVDMDTDGTGLFLKMVSVRVGWL